MTYFNDHVINQTQLIGNQLPIGVFGPLVLLLMVNPVLQLFGRSAPLGAAEFGVIAVMGLSVCGWPGSGFFRTFSASVTMPIHLARTDKAWESVGVMSYVPGCSSKIAPGQVLDWPKLEQVLTQAASASPDTPTGRIAAALPSALMQRLATDADRSEPASQFQDQILAALNNIIEPDQLVSTSAAPLWQQLDRSQLPPDAIVAAEAHDRLADRARSLAEQRNHTADKDAAASLERYITYWQRQAKMMSYRADRAVIVRFAGGAIAPATPGDGLLVANGDADPFVLDSLVRGWDGSHRLTPWQLPWAAWWPTLRLWGGLALFIGVISLCLVLVVHPQWSQRELLAYPIVRFVDELTAPEPGGRLPMMVRNRLFWIGLGLVASIHIIKGLHAWFHAVPDIPLSFNFWAFNSIFPNAAKVDGAYGVFNTSLFLSIIAFAFFLSSEISLSLGLSTFLWLVFGAALIGQGITLTNDSQNASIGGMLRAGAYMGAAVMIVYAGRRYYLKLLAGMFGAPLPAETPAYAVWAGRIAVVCTIGSVALLQRCAGLDWRLGVAVMLLLIVMLLVMTRINVETGAFFVQAGWVPGAVLGGLLGMRGMGPGSFVVVAMISVILVVDPRELLAPFLANAVSMADQVGHVRPARSSGWIGGVMIAGFFVALVATLSLQYNNGVSLDDTWARQVVPSMPFSQTASELSVLSSQDALADAVRVHGWGHFTHAVADPTALVCLGAGLLLVVVCTVARLRLAWWPLHPVIFLVWGTYPMAMTCVSFLLGWAIKAAVMKFMGSNGYRKLLPLMVGVIAGEVIAAIGWTAVGTIYYFVTHTTPASYSILPT